MATIDGLPPLRDVIRDYDLAAKKSLGQNFLLDLNLTAKIARMAGNLSACDVLEVGPGPGGLTRGLLAEGARHILAIEKDPRCIAALGDIAAAHPGRLDVLNADALEVDVAALLTPPIRVVANLPYNIGTELLIRWLTPAVWPPFWDSLTLMFQKEVAERITAQVGDDAYGRLAVVVQATAQARIVMDLPARAFTPPPKVTSAVVHLVPSSQRPEPGLLSALEKTTQAAFGQRRKMLRSSLKTLGGTALCEAASIDPDVRAETVDIDGFLALARQVQSGSFSKA